MKYFILELEVPGNIGPRTVLDRGSHPPKVEFLHFIFEGWLGDQLIESFPCWLVSTTLAQLFTENKITGWMVADVDIELSPQFYETGNRDKLPEFKRLLVSGQINKDDLCVSSDHRLIVSERALSIISLTEPKMMDVFES